MAKKKKITKVKHKHQSFKITPPKPSYERVLFYTIGAAFVGFVAGWYFGNEVITALATYTP